jgi:hypothetical protein
MIAAHEYGGISSPPRAVATRAAIHGKQSVSIHRSDLTSKMLQGRSEFHVQFHNVMIFAPNHIEKCTFLGPACLRFSSISERHNGRGPAHIRTVPRSARTAFTLPHFTSYGLNFSARHYTKDHEGHHNSIFSRRGPIPSDCYSTGLPATGFVLLRCLCQRVRASHGWKGRWQ